MRIGIKAFLAVAIVALLFAGCGPRRAGTQWQGIGDRYVPDPDIPAWRLDAREERVTLTWFVEAEWWNVGFGDDFVTRGIAEDLNIDIRFRVGGSDVLSTIFASGDLPDIITTFNMASTAVRGASLWALPLNELAGRYDPYFFNVASPDTLNWFRMADGNVYGYPNYSNTFRDYADNTIPASTAFLIRRDVYEAIGGLPMRTQEEFAYALSVIRERFPALRPFGTGAGVGYLGTTLQNFLGVPIETDDGEFYDRNLDEDYLSWIRFFNVLHRNGYIDDDRFALPQSIFEEMIRAGSFATILADNLPNLSGSLQLWKADNPGAEYIAIDGPVSALGRPPTLSQAGISGWMINFITRQAVDPAVAIQVFTYLLSERGQMLVFFGREGETFRRLPNGNVEFLPEIAEVRDNDNFRFRNEYRFAEFILFGHDRWNSINEYAFLEAVRQPQAWGRGKLVPQFVIENIAPDPGTPHALSLERVSNEWSRTLINLVRAANDAEFDATLESFRRFRVNNNWDGIVAIYNQNMARNRERLGID